MTKRDILLTIVHRNSNPANDISGNHALAPVAIDKQKPKATMNKYERSVTTAPRSKEPKTGFQTSPMSKMT